MRSYIDLYVDVSINNAAESDKNTKSTSIESFLEGLRIKNIDKFSKELSNADTVRAYNNMRYALETQDIDITKPACDNSFIYSSDFFAKTHAVSDLDLDKEDSVLVDDFFKKKSLVKSELKHDKKVITLCIKLDEKTYKKALGDYTLEKEFYNENSCKNSDYIKIPCGSVFDEELFAYLRYECYKIVLEYLAFILRALAFKLKINTLSEKHILDALEKSIAINMLYLKPKLGQILLANAIAKSNKLQPPGFKSLSNSITKEFWCKEYERGKFQKLMHF